MRHWSHGVLLLQVGDARKREAESLGRSALHSERRCVKMMSIFQKRRLRLRRRTGDDQDDPEVTNRTHRRERDLISFKTTAGCGCGKVPCNPGLRNCFHHLRMILQRLGWKENEQCSWKWT